MIGVDWVTEDDWIGNNLGDSFPGAGINVRDDSKTLIVWRERSISPFLVFIAVIFGDRVILRLGDLDYRYVRRINQFTGFIEALEKGRSGTFIMVCDKYLIAFSILDLLAAGE